MYKKIKFVYVINRYTIRGRKMKDSIYALRRKERIREAIKARKFSETETLAMGFDMINFIVKFREEITHAHHGRDP